MMGFKYWLKRIFLKRRKAIISEYILKEANTYKGDTCFQPQGKFREALLQDMKSTMGEAFWRSIGKPDDLCIVRFNHSIDSLNLFLTKFNIFAKPTKFNPRINLRQGDVYYYIEFEPFLKQNKGEFNKNVMEALRALLDNNHISWIRRDL